MSALALTPDLPCEDYDALLDKRYQLTGLGRPIVDYLASKQRQGRSDRTLDDKERYLASLAMMYPSKQAGAYTPFDVMHWDASQPAASRRHRRSHVNDFFNWAVRWDLIPTNPMARLEAVSRPSQKVYDIFLEPEREALIDLPVRDSALMLVLLDAGARKGEARRLQARHVLPEPMPGQLRIVAGKGGKDRLVPLTHRLSRVLAELALIDGLGARAFYWYDRPGGGKQIRREKAIVESAFQRWWVRCLDAAGVRYRNPHMTRHTFATRWLRRGGRLETLSVAMGHSSIRTTFDLYGHLDMRDVAADIRLIEAEV